MAEPTNEKVLFAFEPRVVMAAMQTTTIRANITAYSTAVGPSSCFRKFTNSLDARRMNGFQFPKNGEKGVGRSATNLTELGRGKHWAGKTVRTKELIEHAQCKMQTSWRIFVRGDQAFSQRLKRVRELTNHLAVGGSW